MSRADEVIERLVIQQPSGVVLPERAQLDRAMRLLREAKSWITPKGNISISIFDRIGKFLEECKSNQPGECVAELCEQRELEWLEHWLLFAAEPVGQDCCNRPGFECCGCPDTCYRTADDIAVAMNVRHEELRALLAQSKEVRP